jgi:WD40 repeat protein
MCSFLTQDFFTPVFATGGRDNFTKLWEIVESDSAVALKQSVLSQSETSVTAVSFHNTRHRVCAVGLSDGSVSIWRVGDAAATPQKRSKADAAAAHPRGRRKVRAKEPERGVLLVRFPGWLAHAQPVLRIRWAPTESCTGACKTGAACRCDRIATVGEDHIVRIASISGIEHEADRTST